MGTVKANSEMFNAVAHGVLKLTLAPTQYSWQFLPILGEAFSDSAAALPLASLDSTQVSKSALSRRGKHTTIALRRARAIRQLLPRSRPVKCLPREIFYPLIQAAFDRTYSTKLGARRVSDVRLRDQRLNSSYDMTIA